MGEFSNGDKLAATREDLAGFKGAVTQELKGVSESVSRIEGSINSYHARMEDLEGRVARIETRGEHDQESAEHRRLRRADRRNQIQTLITVGLFIVAMLTMLHPWG